MGHGEGHIRTAVLQVTSLYQLHTGYKQEARGVVEKLGCTFSYLPALAQPNCSQRAGWQR